MSLFLAMLAWAVVGLVVFFFWYVSRVTTKRWQIWVMAVLCGPCVFALVVSHRLKGRPLC